MGAPEEYVCSRGADLLPGVHNCGGGLLMCEQISSMSVEPVLISLRLPNICAEMLLM